MTTVADIQAAISKLSLEEKAELMASLNAWEDDDWDRQMKADAAAGKFDAMHRAAQEDLRAGRCTPLSSGLGS